MNWSTIITTLIAAIAPCIATIISNKHQLEINKQNNDNQIKLKQFEDYHSKKSDAIYNYIECLSTYIDNQTEQNYTKYKLSMYKVCMYVSKKIYLDISDIDVCLKNKEFKELNCILRSILRTLNDEAQKYNNAN